MAATPHINFTSLKDIQDEDEQKDARKTLNDNAQIIDVKRLIELKSGKVTIGKRQERHFYVLV